MDTRLIFLVSAIFIVAGGAFGLAVGQLVRARNSHSWPTVAATILDAQVRQGSKGWKPQISYSYASAGTRYASDRIVVGWMWDVGGGSARRLVARHAKGSSVPASVDPRDPSYSVLVPGVRIHQIFSVVVCGLVLLPTIALLALSAWLRAAS